MFRLRCDQTHVPLLVVRNHDHVYVIDPALLRESKLALPDDVETSEVLAALEQADSLEPFDAAHPVALRTRLHAIIQGLKA